MEPGLINKKEPDHKGQGSEHKSLLYYHRKEHKSMEEKETKSEMVKVPRKELMRLIEEKAEALTTLEILTEFVLDAKRDYLDADPLRKILGIGRE